MEEGQKEVQIKFSNSQREEVLKSDKILLQASKALILEKKDPYEENPERWFNLVAFCFCIFANGFQWLAFTNISEQFSYFHDKALWKINLFSTLFFIIYPLVSIPEAIFLEKYSIKIGLFIASGGTLLGSFFKIFVHKDKTLAVCYLGQILPALIRPMLLNSPGKISSNWFGDNKRTLICSICCLSDTAGILVGYLWNLAYVKENLKKKDFDDQIFRYFLSEFILIFLFCVPAFFIKKGNPENPSSPSQDKNNLKDLNLADSLKLLLVKKRFIFLAISSFFIVGYYLFVGTSINNLLYIYDLHSKKTTTIFSVSFTAGILSSIIISIILDKNKKFKLFLVSLSFLALIFQAFLTFLLELSFSKNLNEFAIGIVFYILIHSTVIPFYTIGMNYACELTYPVNESISGAVIMSMAHLCGLISFYLFDHFLSDIENKSWLTNVIILVFFFIALIFIFISDEQLIRDEIEKEGRKNSDDMKENNNPKTVEIKQTEKKE